MRDLFPVGYVDFVKNGLAAAVLDHFDDLLAQFGLDVGDARPR